MADSGVHPEARTPDEGAMLSFVEGEFSLAEEVAFRRGLRHAPEVLVRLEAMKRDKALLRAAMLRQPIVPAGLSARVDEALDRAALVSGASGAAHGGVFGGEFHDGGSYDAMIGEPRLVTRVRESRWRVFGRPGVGAGLAIAATLALVSGGVVLYSRVAPVPGSTGAGILADAGPEGESLGSLVGSALEQEIASGTVVGGESGHEGATTVERPADVEASRLASVPGAEPSVPMDVPTIEVSDAGGLPVVATRLLPGGVARRDVMALAEQHRLALRVSADEPMRVIAALEAAAGAESPSGWRVVGDAPPTLALSLGVTIEVASEDGGPDGPAWARPSALAPDVPGPDEPGFDPGLVPDGPMGEPGGVDRDAGRGVPGPAADDAWLLRPTESALAVYLAEVDMSEEGLAELDRDLRRAGQGLGARAGFAALADPLDRVIGRRELLAPAGDALWWHHPPREWSRRTLVPVVVERK